MFKELLNNVYLILIIILVRQKSYFFLLKFKVKKYKFDSIPNIFPKDIHQLTDVLF